MYELQFRLLLIFTVANRLDEHLTLLDGTKISVEPYREYQRRKSSQIVSNICQAPTEDDSRSSSQRSILKQLVLTQNISFDDCHLFFLRSASWSQKVQAFEAPGLISVHTDHSAKKIEVAGRTSDVDLCAAEILELLKKNKTIIWIIRPKHTIEVVRLLKKQESSINKDIYQGARYA